MNEILDALIRQLDLEQLEVNLFRGQSKDLWGPRVFGGQVIGQALVAAERTIEGRVPHSLHAYFLLPGDADAPIVYQVERVRDGRSFSARRVQAIQHGRPILSMIASFQAPEEGLEHAAPMPDVPPPEALTPAVRAERALALRGRSGAAAGRRGPAGPERHRVPAGRAAEPAPALARRAAPGGLVPRRRSRPRRSRGFTGASWPTRRTTSWWGPRCGPHGRSWYQPSMIVASIDHALWFHRAARVDDWLLYAMDSPSAQGARGLARGLIFDRGGRLVASVAQEGLMREVRSPSKKA